MKIVNARKFSYTFSGILVALSFAMLLIWGLKLGIEFTGGSLLEIEFKNTRPAGDKIESALKGAGLEVSTPQPTGTNGEILRFPALSEDQHQKALATLRKFGDLQEKQFTSIGPTIGAELKANSIWAIIVVMIMIVLYISWAFRQVSRPVQSWKYGVAALVALVHDVSIPAGFFAFLGHFYGVTVDSLFVTALLTILGFSVHDTIVVFDRVRENLKKIGSRENFEDVVEMSLRQTIGRSINTSLTVMLVMLALYLFGGATTHYFSLAILIGVFFGTYSSIFIASFILVTWNKFSAKRA